MIDLPITPDPAGMSDPDSAPASTHEQRKRLALRALVDEMLDQIRATSASDTWTAEERRRAEEDLERIMNQVRHEAISDGAPDR